MKGQRGNSRKTHLNPKNINGESGVQILEVWVPIWIPTIKKHNNRRATQHRTPKKTTRPNSHDRNVRIIAVENQPIKAEHCAYKVT